MSKVKNKKKVATTILAVAVLFIAIASVASACVFAYKLGYKDGTNNQVLCQASLKDATLTKLCK